MADFDVCVRLFAFTDAREKVEMMPPKIGAAAAFLHEPVAFPIHFPPLLFAQHHHPFRAVEHIPILHALLLVWRPDAHLKNQLFRPAIFIRRILEKAVLRVRPLHVVVKNILAAHGANLGGMRIHSQAPAGEVNVVHAIIAHVARAKIMPPTPNTVQHVGPKLYLGSRP